MQLYPYTKTITAATRSTTTPYLTNIISLVVFYKQNVHIDIVYVLQMLYNNIFKAYMYKEN